MFYVFTVHLYVSFYHQTTLTVFPGKRGLDAGLQLSSSGIRTEMLQHPASWAMHMCHHNIAKHGQ
jgi:hypothetical protein